MEGDARGAIGGMEMPEKERRRLAEESRGWRCQGCGGRSNESILEEEGGGAGEGCRTEAVIPEELKFGFKDEMGKGGDKEKGKENVQPEQPPEASQTGSTSTPAVSEVPPATPAVAVTNTPPPVPVSASAQVPQLQPTPTTRPGPQSRGSPAWLDKAITGVAAALMVMVIKKVIV